MTESLLLRQSVERWKPHSFQKSGSKFLQDHGAAGLFASPGAGKTSMTLDAFMKLKKKGLADKALIIAPLRPCYLVWPREVDKWKQFEELTYTVLHGPDKEDRLQDDVDLYIINPEGLQWLFDAQTFTKPNGKKGVTLDPDRIKELGVDTLIIDELTAFKNHTSIRFQMMKTVLGLFARRWGLTGSPAANGLMGLFGQVYMLDEGRSFGPWITKFRHEYFDQHPYSKYRWDLKPDGEARIFERLKPLVMRVDAADYIDMPQQVDLIIDIDLPEKARKVYDQVEKDYFAFLDGEEELAVSAPNKGVALMRCEQLAGGAIYVDDVPDGMRIKKVRGRGYTELFTEKLDALEELVDELQGEPLLLAYHFKHDLDRILGKFKGAPFIGDGQSPEETAEIEAAWNAGEIPLLPAHPQSMGHGLNLQGSAFHVGWFTPTWDYELYDQFIRRVLRQGNKHKRVFNHLFVARDTVDEDKVWSLRHKAAGQDRLFEATNLRRRNRK